MLIYKNFNNFLLVTYKIIINIFIFIINLFHNNFFFLEKYYIRNEYFWQDGFLFDFVQKKTIDLWVRQFVIYTGFIFSERYIFENIVYLYLSYFFWPSHYYSLFETNNVSEMLTNILYLFIIIIYFFIFNLLILVY